MLGAGTSRLPLRLELRWQARPEQSSGAKAVLTLLIAYDRSLAAGKLQTKRVLYRAAPACNADRLPNFSGLRVR